MMRELSNYSSSSSSSSRPNKTKKRNLSSSHSISIQTPITNCSSSIDFNCMKENPLLSAHLNRLADYFSNSSTTNSMSNMSLTNINYNNIPNYPPPPPSYGPIANNSTHCQTNGTNDTVSNSNLMGQVPTTPQNETNGKNKGISSQQPSIPGDEKPYVCQEESCGKSFKQLTHLNAHRLTHSGERPFICTFCAKTFSRAGHLKRHIYIHTGERPYGCKVCSSRFNQKVHLLNHLRKHSGEKPFICSICKRKFTRNSYVIRHLRTHANSNKNIS